MYGKNDIDHPSHGGGVAPIVPGVTGIAFRVNFPTTELLVQPPTIIAVPHLEVGKPLGHDRYEGCVHPNANAYPRPTVSSTSKTQSRSITNVPTRLTTNQLSPAAAIFRSCAHSQRNVIPPFGPLCAEYTVLLRRIRLFLSIMESCIQSVKTHGAGGFSFRMCEVLPRTKKNQPIVVKSSYFLGFRVRYVEGLRGAFCAHWISDISPGSCGGVSFV